MVGELSVDGAPSGALRIVALCRECQELFGTGVKLRTVAVLVELSRQGEGQLWDVARHFRASETTVRHDLMRLGKLDRHGRTGLGMVEEAIDERTGDLIYRPTVRGTESMAALLAHMPLPRGT